MSLLLLLQTQGALPTPQGVSGTLAMSGGLTFRVRTPVALTGTLTVAGALTTVIRVARALAGTLTSAATLSTVYTPPSPGGGDAILTRLRRNQTD